MKMISVQYNCQCMLLVSSRWLTSYASKWGGWLKSCVSKFWVAQNCARKFQVTILLRDPLTIPAY